MYTEFWSEDPYGGNCWSDLGTECKIILKLTLVEQGVNGWTGLFRPM
jgi:hypothetical protein